ncbi:MAG TPA: hypothetical protein VNW73_03160, partial [Ktedonobacteraceae bacterium]|nr:hypothetical protein [Ktedonobacteraceae bacterium]
NSAPCPTRHSNYGQVANRLCGTAPAALRPPGAKRLGRWEANSFGRPRAARASRLPRPSCHVPDDLPLRHIGRGQIHLGDHPRPTQVHMQPKAIESMATGMVFAKAGRVIEAMAAVARAHWQTGMGILSTMATVGSKSIKPSRIRHHSRFLTAHKLAAWRTKVVRATCVMAEKKCA